MKLRVQAPIDANRLTKLAKAIKRPEEIELLRQKVDFLTKKVRDSERQNEKLNLEISDRREFLEIIAGSVMATEPYPPYRFQQKSKGKTSVVPGFKFSDWHIGERIQKDETEGFNSFNFDIAQRRIFGITDDMLGWVETQRSAYPITECAILCEGDFVSGDIHEELRITNEFPLPVQAAKAGNLLGEVLARIAPNFDSVVVYQVEADNHGRLVKKPQAKQKSANNMNYVVYEIANNYLKKHKNVHIVRGQGAKILAEINNFKFLVEHGDGLKSWMGIPFYGIQRLQGREAARRMNTTKGFHYHCLLPGQSYWRDDGSVVPVEKLSNGSAISGIDGFEVSSGEILNRNDYSGGCVSIVVSGLPDPLRLTDSHPVFSLPGFYPCGQFKKPGKTFLLNGKRKPLEANWREASSLKTGDFMYYPVPQKVEGMDELSDDDLRLIGFYVSEGWTSRDGQYTKFAFNPKTEQRFFDWVLEAMENKFGVRGSECLLQDGRRYAIRFSRKQIGKFFQLWGGRYHSNKRLRSELMYLPPIKQRIILNAWLQGDGHFGKNNVTGYTTSEVLGRQMYIIACRCGLNPRIWKKNAHDNHKTSWGVHFGYRSWNRAQTNTIPRFVARRIKSVVRLSYSGQTFNCSVPVGEAYVVGGILLHNSIGHWHVPSIIEWKTIINGSLSGTSEYDHIAGRHADPSQVAFLVHREHGLFNPTAFKKI